MLRLLAFCLCLAVLFCSTEGYTYWERTCELKRMNLDCGSGEIDIIRAAYGRRRLGVCGGGSNTNCYASSSMRVVTHECQGQSHCTLHVENSAFGDPCYGTGKYLEVTYRCLWKSKPHREGILKRICESKWGDISCYGSDRINILSAFYGRKTGGHICPGTVRTTSCETSAYSYVRSKCQDRQGCRLHAHNHHFGDPCYGTGKYLEVRYRCE